MLNLYSFHVFVVVHAICHVRLMIDVINVASRKIMVVTPEDAGAYDV